MGDEDWVRAARWRSTLAGLIDAAFVGVLAWQARAGADAPAAAASRMRWVRLVPAEAVREQLGTPGQWLLGIRTVDRRTGERVALWRSALLTATAAGGQAIVTRLQPAVTAEDERANRAIAAEMQEIRRRANDPATQQAEIMAVYERHRRPVGRELSRAMALTLASSLLNRRLRRHLAPTRQVLVRRRDDHNP